MEKDLKVCYKGSGVKSLKGCAIFWIVFAVVGVILSLIGLINIGNYEEETGTLLLIIGVSAILTGCILAPLFRGFSTIAETALFQKYLIMEEYKIIETDAISSADLNCSKCGKEFSVSMKGGFCQECGTRL